ncbi:hypothetical protein chiPu_0017762 [Chiloscyllium punctatum]|uniref:Uncharacterized protein n=1 Tax=Chiloscyllium punctatum TaxID=137246 RepID=A0A401RIT2_CHIPU|nr:hypothetical protein [Chiloscyllium punctatum]
MGRPGYCNIVPAEAAWFQAMGRPGYCNIVPAAATRFQAVGRLDNCHRPLPGVLAAIGANSFLETKQRRVQSHSRCDSSDWSRSLPGALAAVEAVLFPEF